MNDLQMKAIAALEDQQACIRDRSPRWMVAQQLMDICRREPGSAELIARDLAIKDMSITEAEKKIRAFADKHKTGNFACVTPAESDRILREFYGLPGPDEAGAAEVVAAPATTPDRSPASAHLPVNLEDFL